MNKDKTRREDPQQSDIEKLKQERDEYLDGWKRAKADLINYKKDEFKRFEEVIHFANEDIILDLLTVLDSFELAVGAMEKSGAVERGVYLIKGQLQDVLRKRGLERIEAKEGGVFDPSVHEAVAVLETEAEMDNIVAGEVEVGYALAGKVIRAAKVRVYKRKE